MMRAFKERLARRARDKAKLQQAGHPGQARLEAAASAAASVLVTAATAAPRGPAPVLSSAPEQVAAAGQRQTPLLWPLLSRPGPYKKLPGVRSGTTAARRVFTPRPPAKLPREDPPDTPEVPPEELPEAPEETVETGQTLTAEDLASEPEEKSYADKVRTDAKAPSMVLRVALKGDTPKTLSRGPLANIWSGHDWQIFWQSATECSPTLDLWVGELP